MNRLMMHYPMMDEVTATTGEGGGGTAPDNTSAAPAAEAQKEPTSLMEDTGDKPTETPAATTEEPKGPTSLLDDDQPDQPEKPTESAAEEPTAEQIAEWTKGIKALDMGDGVQWSDELLNGMAPALMGLTKDQQEKTIKRYADLQAKQAKAIAEQNDAFNNGQIKQCFDRFGGKEETRKVARLANKGGEAIFAKHPEIWKVLKSTPSFANNPDVMECFAEYGRGLNTDTGRVTPKEGGGESDRGDVLHRMYGNVKP